YLRLRRVADVLLAGTGLVVGSVPMAMVALGVMATMGRPVIFTQDRITRDGRIFRLRKFRSMRSAGTDPTAQEIGRASRRDVTGVQTCALPISTCACGAWRMYCWPGPASWSDRSLWPWWRWE